MPTENRSSNTEQMVSVPASKLKKIHRDLDACQKVIWLRGGFDPAYCKDAQDSLKDIDALLAQPAAQHQGEPVGWTYEDGKEYTACPDHAHDLRAEGIELTPVYRHPPTSDGFSAGDMADQGAKAFAARDPEVKRLRTLLDAAVEALRSVDQALTSETPEEIDRDEIVRAIHGDDWVMNPCSQGHRDVGAAGGTAGCYQCNEHITAETTREAFEQWNATHTPLQASK
ncbi:hypothetical protein [Pseudomonas donghuensis]|uniref:hypothetical protein n=1 Tax=Pseudomonas donghuensis TaxID=1163398 RepID=UPI002E0E0F7F|nr:hypothetical protein VP780_10275 [Pseudomonas donghuensis]